VGDPRLIFRKTVFARKCIVSHITRRSFMRWFRISPWIFAKTSMCSQNERFRVKKLSFWETHSIAQAVILGNRHPLPPPSHWCNMMSIANDKLTWRHRTGTDLCLIRSKSFVAFEKYDMTRIFKLFLHKGRNLFFKKSLLSYIARCNSMSWFRISLRFCTKTIYYSQK
jgi:hypothetical protein